MPERSELMNSTLRWPGLALLTIAVAAMVSITNPTISTLTVIYLLAWAGAIAATYERRTGVAGAATLYLGVFGMFHGGLLVAYSVIGNDALIGQGDNSFVTAEVLAAPVSAVVAGLFSATAGYLIARQIFPDGVAKTERAVDQRRLTRVSVGAVLLGMAIVFGTLITQGVSANSGYGGFLAAAESHQWYGYGTSLVGFGCAFLMVGPRRARVSGVLLISLYGSVLLVLGSRGAVLFPVIAMVYAYGRSRTVQPRWALAAGGITLGAVSVLRETRAVGLHGLLTGEGRFSPWLGLAEMGYSILPVAVVQSWMDGGLPPRNGASLFAVPIGFFESLLGTGGGSGSGSRLLNVEIFERYGPIGGSPIAEGLRNGGLPFVVLLMAVIGGLLWLASRSGGTRASLWGVVILLPLLIETRNSFAPVPVQWALGAVIVLLATAGSREKPASGLPTSRAADRAGSAHVSMTERALRTGLRDGTGASARRGSCRLPGVSDPR